MQSCIAEALASTPHMRWARIIPCEGQYVGRLVQSQLEPDPMQMSLRPWPLVPFGIGARLYTVPVVKYAVSLITVAMQLPGLVLVLPSPSPFRGILEPMWHPGTYQALRWQFRPKGEGLKATTGLQKQTREEPMNTAA